MHSETVKEIAAALALAQGELAGGVLKDSQNPILHSRYAGLSEVLRTALPVLSKHGLSVVQGFRRSGDDGGGRAITTRIYHSSGEWIDCGELTLPELQPSRGTNLAQMLGSAITYCRRYAAMAAVGLSSVDDDGNDAGGAAPGGGSRVQQARTQARPVVSGTPPAGRPGPSSGDARPRDAAPDGSAPAGWSIAMATQRLNSAGSPQDIARLLVLWEGSVPDAAKGTLQTLVGSRMRALGAEKQTLLDELEFARVQAEM